MNGKSTLASQVCWWVLACVLACVLVAVPAAAFALDAHEAVGRAPYADTMQPQSHAARQLAKNIVLDRKQIWTSLFRMARKSAEWWLIFAAAAGALIATDHRSSQQLPNTGDRLAFSRRVSRLGAVYTLVPIVGGFYLSGLLNGHSKLRDTGLLGAEALDALPSGHSIGKLCARFGNRTSVPRQQSGCDSRVWSRHYGWGVSLSARQHSASDIVVGGVLIGWLT